MEYLRSSECSTTGDLFEALAIGGDACGPTTGGCLKRARDSTLVSVREDIESDESVVIQEWRPDSGGAASDVDDRKSCPL